MRVSDEQRQRVIDELRRHCAAGRLDIDEYGDRVEQALAASSLEDLDRVLGDLPMMRIADPVGSTSAVGTGRGSYSSQASGPATRVSRMSTRLAASAVVLMTVVVVLATALLVATAHWTWSLVLVGGWLLGLIQSRVAARRR